MLMAMGMMKLSPLIISLPFKIHAVRPGGWLARLIRTLAERFRHRLAVPPAERRWRAGRRRPLKVALDLFREGVVA